MQCTVDVMMAVVYNMNWPPICTDIIVNMYGWYFSSNYLLFFRSGSAIVFFLYGGSFASYYSGGPTNRMTSNVSYYVWTVWRVVGYENTDVDCTNVQWFEVCRLKFFPNLQRTCLLCWNIWTINGRCLCNLLWFFF